MRLPLLFVMLLASSTLCAQSVRLDKPERTVAGVCLCYTTLDDLEKAGNIMQPVNVPEMEYPEKGPHPDSGYVYGKGYITARYPGMVFQTEPNSRYIAKIRLTQDFKGQLPDGKAIDVRQLKAGDVLRMYPELVNRWMWMSRYGSDYLLLSNSLIHFYVRKDYHRKPMYPIDDAYYRKKPIAGIDLIYSCHPAVSGPDLAGPPNYYVDSVLVPDLSKVNISGDFARLTALTHSTDKISVGSNGAIFIETKKFVRHRCWNIFSEDQAYRKLVPSQDTDSGVVYILKGKPLFFQPESFLAEVTAETFAGLVILDKTVMKKKYGTKGDKPGVVIKLKSDK